MCQYILLFLKVNGSVQCFLTTIFRTSFKLLKTFYFGTIRDLQEVANIAWEVSLYLYLLTHNSYILHNYSAIYQSQEIDIGIV